MLQSSLICIVYVMVLGQHILQDGLNSFLKMQEYDQVLILVDEVVYRLHTDYLDLLREACDAKMLSFPSGERNKTLDRAVELWKWLMASGATRRSILVTIGGGALTDLGGFVASTYMRGIRTVNVPTTLLGMVDASVGGKTAIDFEGIKNIIGAFHTPIEVFIDVHFLDRLPLSELYSGYAEVIKTALLKGQAFWQDILRYDDPQMFDTSTWIDVIGRAIEYKDEVVTADPKESGLRKVLNLGHTIGHALEAFSHQASKHKPLLHGEAVAIGLIVELYLSMIHLNMDRNILRQLQTLVKELYSPFSYSCRDYAKILELMRYDKKNSGSNIHLVGLIGLGEPKEIVLDNEEEIKEALDFYRETLGS